MVGDFETQLWTDLQSSSWGDTLKSDSVFNELYIDSVQRIKVAIKKGAHDVLLDVGCGTGDIIGRLEGKLSLFLSFISWNTLMMMLS